MVTVTINTLNEDWGNLSRELTAWLKQADQVIVSTTDADRNIAAIRGQFPTVDIVTMPHGEHPGHSPLGSFMQLNNAMPHVKGEWWCFASGNDYVYPNKIADELATAKRTGALVVYSDFNYTDETGDVKSRQRFKKYVAVNHDRQNIIPDCSLIHRSILDEFMPFRCEQFRNYSYWDLWLRARAKYGASIFAHCDSVTWGYRQASTDMHVRRMKSEAQKMEAQRDRSAMLSSHAIGGRCSVVSFCIDDHANFMWEQSKALNTAGVSCRAMKFKAHPYDYPEQAEIVDTRALREAIRGAQYVMVYFSLRSFNAVQPYLKGKKLIMHYAGTDFRINRAACLRAINPYVFRSVIALGEFNGCGAKMQRYVSVTVDTDKIGKYARKVKDGPLTVGHYPSNPTVKGTVTIRQALSTVTDAIVHIDETLMPYDESLKRMALCDIYVELFAPTNHGYPYGSFGTTAVEAAAMGKVVITQNLYADFYEAEYGQCPLILAKSPKDITEAVNRLVSMPRDEFRTLAAKFKAWADSCHSYSATGERLKRLVIN